MSIYHTHIKTFSRARGDSSVAAAAYRAGLLLRDEKTGLKHDYRVRRGVVHSHIVAPDEAPDWSCEPTKLWPAAEAAERRKDATVAREFEIALPHELDDEQRLALTSHLTRRLVDRYGFAAQASIHSPFGEEDSLNHHVHILATTRRLGPEGLANKTRELDGGTSGKVEVEWVRKMVGDTINQHLQRAGVAARVDHRRLSKQAAEALERGDIEAAVTLTREPLKHIGKNAMAMYRKGMEVEAMEENLAIRLANQRQVSEGLRLWNLRVLGTDTKVPDTLLATTPDGTGIQMEGGLPVVRTVVPSEQRKAAEAAFKEAEQLWSEPFHARFHAILVMTARFFKNSRERLMSYVERPPFLLHLKNLVWRLRRLRNDAAEVGRRKVALSRAIQALDRAEEALEKFDQAPARDRLWTRREWARRRRGRLDDVKAKRRAYVAASQAAEEQQLADCSVRATASAEEVEQWSKILLERYPTPQDILDRRAAASAELQAPLFTPEDVTRKERNGRGALGSRMPPRGRGRLH